MHTFISKTKNTLDLQYPRLLWGTLKVNSHLKLQWLCYVMICPSGQVIFIQFSQEDKTGQAIGKLFYLFKVIDREYKSWVCAFLLQKMLVKMCALDVILSFYIDDIVFSVKEHPHHFIFPLLINTDYMAAHHRAAYHRTSYHRAVYHSYWNWDWVANAQILFFYFLLYSMHNFSYHQRRQKYQVMIRSRQV